LYGNDLNKKNPIYDDGEHKKVYQVENEAGNLVAVKYFKHKMS
jgi:hypothetical protein